MMDGKQADVRAVVATILADNEDGLITAADIRACFYMLIERIEKLENIGGKHE